MKKSINFAIISICLLLVTTLSSCEAIGDIFKAGVWSGIIIVVLVLGLIIFLATRGKKS